MFQHVVLAAYGFDPDAHSAKFGLDTGTDTPTIQSAKEECDINTIVERFGITGDWNVPLSPVTLADFTEIGDYRDAIECVKEADARFMELPGEVRGRFGNSPQAFMEWCESRDDKGNRLNIEDLRRYGLAPPERKEPVIPPVKVEVINPVKPP